MSNIDDSNPEMLLEEARTALQNEVDIHDNDVIWKLHALAELQYGPAFDFLVSCLDSDDDDWRLEGLRDIGFHYNFQAGSDLMTKIRQMLLTDSDVHVRMAAASVLGSRSEWPDQALLTALQSDADEFVQQASFEAILELAGIPLPEIRDYKESLQSGGIPLSVTGLAQVFNEKGLDVDLSG